MPDPRHGVFETLLVIDGRPVELDAHLARLNASLAELYPDHDPLALDVPDEARPREAALRITVSPGAGRRLEVLTAVRGIERRQGPVALRSMVLPGGLGAHKWADRSLLEEAQAGLPAGALPLLVDEDGALLEASRANVFAVHGNALLTPPTDGRILPGITRARLIEIAGDAGFEVNETTLRREDLLAADEVFLSGSVCGIEPVASLDGANLTGQNEVGSDLAVQLLQAWTAAKVG